jgi:phosphatidylethanolamine-binding protein (PEBP) family uncharacterized protein
LWKSGREGSWICFITSLLRSKEYILLSGRITGNSRATSVSRARTSQLPRIFTMKIKSPASDADGVIPDKFTQYDANRSLPLELQRRAAERAFARAHHGRSRRASRNVYALGRVRHGFQHERVFRESHPKGRAAGAQRLPAARACWSEPPEGEHRYFLHLYALDQRFDLPNGAARKDVERAMVGHIIAEAELMARYATPVAAR